MRFSRQLGCAFLLPTFLALTGCSGDARQQSDPSPFDRFEKSSAPRESAQIVFAQDSEKHSASQYPSPRASTGPSDADLRQGKFDHCGMVRRTCVVDGDTFWLNGEKIRIADIDTPEISQPQCPYEKQLGLRATDRLIGLLNAGPFELHTIGERDTDQYGRMLRVVVRDGKSLGDQLVSEGLARTWTGRREPWC